ncbi:CDP-alcohol phosphatidyltransferase family protein [Facilibium subflavum]|uniref:CDP-alcohol phosphatidyltransferase family protein n=1 Tax=Facilibium subflavum TaxID=2219058 RepID=UPI000E65D741|nr:CDP-alcohol phosphatidyltransferase family protein [Facilibium subflavum]
MTITFKKAYAWFVHLFTASGAVFAVLSLAATTQAYAAKIQADPSGYFFYMRLSFIYVVIAVVIDAVDGTLARRVNIKKLAPLDGSLLDNIIDFVTYAVIPALWVYITDVVPHGLKVVSLSLIVLASCYQFCQLDAKTKDHFFKGFPSYWNLAIYYLIYFHFSAITNFILIIILTILTFVPIKYIYPSRMSYLSRHKLILSIMFIYTLIWGAATILSSFMWPHTNTLLAWVIISYIVVYFVFSAYRTLYPLK